MHLQTDRHRTAIRPLTDGHLVSQAAALVGLSAWSCDLASEQLQWTDGVFDIFGLARDTHFERRDTVALYCEESREIMLRLRAQAIETCSGFSMEAQIRQPGGDIRWLRLAANTRMENGRAVQLYGMKQDITQERLRWEQLRHLAENDPLTGLGNRARFQSEFLDLPTGSDRLARIGALAMFDLNDFKGINDRWGHAAGDACIARFGERLAGAFPGARLIARIGGDEFAALLPASVPATALEAVVRRRINRLVTRVEWQGTLIPIGVSAGLAFTCGSPAATFAAADAALYAAKRSGRNVLRVAA
ncbi:GGDEF domain-containing protein [Novosphingobium guangzhouense]|uniref:Diguanylate cyclase n=1 Tax=Novosphingobium guangzhouense TaxID=1850347 RepID=A0A2K2G6E7_9SPHN|nr:diguanylate cyclase [Novosphingobium guangzhouense]PNU06615.1 diguanylate cyclase [Novosphingobium guangzhouense]